MLLINMYFLWLKAPSYDLYIKNKRIMIKNSGLFIVFIASLISAACSSMNSIIIAEDNGENLKGGVPYFMPKKDFLVTVTIKDGATTFASSTTPAYPDLSQIYVLHFQDSLISDNLLNVVIGTDGLLTNINSKTESKLNEIFKNLAKSAGAISTLAMNKDGSENNIKYECIKDGKYVFRYTEPGNYTACDDIKISITQLGTFSLTKEKMNHGKKKENRHNGVFFKLNIPYTIVIEQTIEVIKDINNTKIQKKVVEQKDLVFSPSESPVFYLPGSQSLFANKEATFTFTDGMLTSYKQDNKSELAALASLPADLISGYFSSIGNIFGQISSASDAEKSAITSSLSLELAKMKNELCIAAINANNSEAIEDLQCTQ